MPDRAVTHATFTIDRRYDAAPRRVFAAWADPAIKTQWFKGPDEWEGEPFSSDFRVGGRESSRGGPKGGPVHAFEALYHDIVPEQRIVFTYDMYFDQTRISVSLASVEFIPDGGGTRLIYTEHGAFLDGIEDPAEREHGTRELLDALDAALRRQPANA